VSWFKRGTTVKPSKAPLLSCTHQLQVWIEDPPKRPGYPPSYRPAYLHCTTTHDPAHALIATHRNGKRVWR